MASRGFGVASNSTSISVAEPATVVTDYLIAGACGYFAFSLAMSGASTDWVLGFVLGGLSALVGGTVHGFPELGGKRGHEVLWSLTLLLFGASAAAFGAGALSVAYVGMPRFVVQLAAVAALGAYVFSIVRKPQFRTAGKMTLLMLAAFWAMSVSLALRDYTTLAGLMVACVLLNAAGIAVQMIKLAPHPRFNHNDLFHVFQLAALWCLYLAVRAIS
ncbi:MAG: DUF6962 family protein [Gemmatimonadaceae bacterium]